MRIAPCPIIEAVIEIRFSSKIPADVIPEYQQLRVLKTFVDKLLNDSEQMPSQYNEVFVNHLEDILA